MVIAQKNPEFLIFRRGPVKNPISTKIAKFRQKFFEFIPWKSGLVFYFELSSLVCYKNSHYNGLYDFIVKFENLDF